MGRGKSASADGSWSYDERQATRRQIIEALIEQPDEETTRSLAAAAKVINDYERATLRHEEDVRDAAAVAELTKNNRARSRMRSGVIREDEAPELPVARGPEPH